MTQETSKELLTTLSNMQVWQQLGVEISRMENDYLQFKRGNIYIMIPEFEILIFGADKIRRMFAQLDS